MEEIGLTSYQRLIESTSQKILQEGGTLELPAAPPALHQAFNISSEMTDTDPALVDWNNLVLLAGSNIYRGLVLNDDLRQHFQALLQAQRDVHERSSMLTLRLHELTWQKELAQRESRIMDLSLKLDETNMYNDR